MDLESKHLQFSGVSEWVSQFCRQLAWTTNKIWWVWWEALCWWEAWGPGPLGPLKSGPEHWHTYMTSHRVRRTRLNTTREISRETGLSQRAVIRIVHEDPKLKCLKKGVVIQRHCDCRAEELTMTNHDPRLERCKLLLLSKFSDYFVNFVLVYRWRESLFQCSVRRRRSMLETIVFRGLDSTEARCCRHKVV